MKVCQHTNLNDFSVMNAWHKGPLSMKPIVTAVDAQLDQTEDQNLFKSGKVPTNGDPADTNVTGISSRNRFRTIAALQLNSAKFKSSSLIYIFSLLHRQRKESWSGSVAIAPMDRRFRLT